MDTECRVFQEKWTASYLFTDVNGKPVCLVCMQHVSVFNEYNIRRHYETQHGEKYDSLLGQLRQEKINELLVGLKKQQSVFTWSREVNDAAVKANYIIANEIALASKPYYVGSSSGVVTKFREKVQAANGGDAFWTFHCILHQEALCSKSLKMDHVMEVVVRTVNFIRARGLN